MSKLEYNGGLWFYWRSQIAQHSVEVHEHPIYEIKHKDMVLKIKSDGAVLGTLTISRGGVGWLSTSDKLERHFSWEQFDRMVNRQWEQR